MGIAVVEDGDWDCRGLEVMEGRYNEMADGRQVESSESALFGRRG